MLKKYLCVLLSFMFVFSVTAYAEEFDVSAYSAVLINAQTGKVVYEKNGYETRSMASTTKIMTSLIAIEQGTPNRIVEVTDEMLNVEGTSVGLKSGDKISMESLVYSMLLESGNDAANVTAFAIGDSLETFAEIMNNKAKKIGMKSTNFVTPSGLDDENHYTTAYDMALLGAYAINNPDFMAISSSKKAEVSFGNPMEMHTLYNHNKMLSNYEGAVGIKTGFTKKSGRCLVTAAKRDNVTLVCAVLNAPNDWDDTKKLLDYGFSNEKNVQLADDALNLSLNIVGGTKNSVKLKLAQIPTYSQLSEDEINRIKVKTYIKKFEYAPVQKDLIVGYNIYILDDKIILKVPIVTCEKIKINNSK